MAWVEVALEGLEALLAAEGAAEESVVSNSILDAIAADEAPSGDAIADAINSGTGAIEVDAESAPTRAMQEIMKRINALESSESVTAKDVENLQKLTEHVTEEGRNNILDTNVKKDFLNNAQRIANRVDNLAGKISNVEPAEPSRGLGTPGRGSGISPGKVAIGVGVGGTAVAGAGAGTGKGVSDAINNTSTDNLPNFDANEDVIAAKGVFAVIKRQLENREDNLKKAVEKLPNRYSDLWIIQNADLQKEIRDNRKEIEEIDAITKVADSKNASDLLAIVNKQLAKYESRKAEIEGSVYDTYDQSIAKADVAHLNNLLKELGAAKDRLARNTPSAPPSNGPDPVVVPTPKPSGPPSNSTGGNDPGPAPAPAPGPTPGPTPGPPEPPSKPTDNANKDPNDSNTVPPGPSNGDQDADGDPRSTVTDKIISTGSSSSASPASVAYPSLGNEPKPDPFSKLDRIVGGYFDDAGYWRSMARQRHVMNQAGLLYDSELRRSGLTRGQKRMKLI